MRRRCALVPIPEAPPWVAGLVDLHGDPLPVLDLQARVFRQASATALTEVLVICRWEQRRAALLVQELGAVLHDRSLELRDEVNDVPHAAFVVGATHVDDETMLVLGVSQIIRALTHPDEGEEGQ